MSHSNGIIKAPISLPNDVFPTLGLSALNGNAPISYAARNAHGKTNPWSRFKPVHILRTLFPDRTTKWWKGTEGNCGIKVKAVTTYAQIPGVLDMTDNMNGWVYEPPTGGEVSPCRVGDFDGYDHNAQCPVGSFEVASQVMQGGYLIGDLMMRAAPDDDTKPGGLALSDIDAGGDNLANYHLGIVVTDRDGNIKGRVAGPGLECRFKVGGLLLNTQYYAYPFLAKTAMGQDETDVTNTYYTIPNAKRKAFKVVTSEQIYNIDVQFTAKWLYLNLLGGGQEKAGVSWSVTLKASRLVNVTRATVYLKYETSNNVSTLLAGEDAMVLDPFSFGGTGDSAQTLKRGIFSSWVDGKGYKVVLYLMTDAGTIEKATYPIEKFEGGDLTIT